MDRRLHNNLSALAASGAVLVVALVSASPLPSAGPRAEAGDASPASALLAALERAGAPDDATADTGAGDAPTTGRSGTDGLRHLHRRIAMPYFTFLPRG